MCLNINVEMGNGAKYISLGISWGESFSQLNLFMVVYEI